MSTRYVVTFTLIMTFISAFLLAGLFYATAPMAKKGEEVFNKRAILAAVGDYLPTPLGEMSDEDVLTLFENNIEQVSLGMDGGTLTDITAVKIDLAQERKKPEADRKLPFFKYKGDGKTFYIMSMRGKGLWDDIWGNIAVESDLNTIAGASFDHKGETPGLGAEIKDSPKFSYNFIGKTLYDSNGNYDPVKVAKGAAKPNTNSVDGISGATITGDGVGDMVWVWLKFYEPYLNKLKSETKIGMK